MEMPLFEKGGKVYTRFKVSLKRLWAWKGYLKNKYGVDTNSPVKESSRFIYFEKEGDLINKERDTD